MNFITFDFLSFNFKTILLTYILNLNKQKYRSYLEIVLKKLQLPSVFSAEYKKMSHTIYSFFYFINHSSNVPFLVHN